MHSETDDDAIYLRQRVRELEDDLDEVELRLRASTVELQELQSSVGFRTIAWLRNLAYGLFPENTLRGRYLLAVLHLADILQTTGLKTIAYRLLRPREALRYLRAMRVGSTLSDAEYGRWLAKIEPTKVQLLRQTITSEGWQYRPTISILLPVYNSHIAFLEKAIDSVTSQTYPHWELCISDDKSTNEGVRRVLNRASERDPRIKVTFREINGHISANSNSALSLATGEFVGLLDHDDILRPDALFEVVQLLQFKPDLDLIYTDEDKLSSSESRVSVFFKPAWSPDLLMSANYLTHFTVIRRSLLEAVGAFRKGYEGSQDYDLFLRVTERTEKIGHIPKPLYSWRQAPGSAALSLDAKPYAYRAAQRALEDALQRRGLRGRVVPAQARGWYHVRYIPGDSPLISIIISGSDEKSLRRSARRVDRKTSYSRHEILLCESKSQSVSAPCNSINESVSRARGQHIVFLDSNAVVQTNDWLETLLEHSARAEVGAVGACILGPSGIAVDQGLVLGLRGQFAGVCAHPYFRLGDAVRNCSAVSRTCMMVRRDTFLEIGGWDDHAWSFQDVDFCLRLWQKNLRVVYTPHCRVVLDQTLETPTELTKDSNVVNSTVEQRLTASPDPFYNPNFALNRPYHLQV